MYVRILPEDCVSHLDLPPCWMQRTKDAATWLDDVVSHTMDLLDAPSRSAQSVSVMERKCNGRAARHGTQFRDVRIASGASTLRASKMSIPKLARIIGASSQHVVFPKSHSSAETPVSCDQLSNQRVIHIH